MPFLTASTTVAKLLDAGALSYAEALIGRGINYQRIVELLAERYPGPRGSPIPFSTYAAVRDRALSALTSGRLLSDVCFDSPCSRIRHTGTTAIMSRYQYNAVLTFYDPLTNREFTKPFAVNSQTALSGRDILEQATEFGRQMAMETAPGTDPRLAIPGIEFRGADIKDALVRINPS